jgi:DNA-binding GntR family transcriptional regulator
LHHLSREAARAKSRVMSGTVTTASLIERDILSGRLVTGTFVGTRAELGERYKVGR